MRNIPSTCAYCIYRITFSDFKVRILIEITESPGNVIYY